MIKDKTILRKLDVVFGVVMLIASLVMLGLSAAMPTEGMGGAMQSSFWIAPGALPVVVSAVLVLLSVVLIVGGIKAGAKITSEDMQKLKAVLCTKAAKYTYLVSGMLIIYICFLLGNRHLYDILGYGLVPYATVTTVYLMVFMFLLKTVRWYWIVSISIVIAWGVGYLFQNVAQVLLP